MLVLFILQMKTPRLRTVKSIFQRFQMHEAIRWENHCKPMLIWFQSHHTILLGWWGLGEEVAGGIEVGKIT